MPDDFTCQLEGRGGGGNPSGVNGLTLNFYSYAHFKVQPKKLPAGQCMNSTNAIGEYFCGLIANPICQRCCSEQRPCGLQQMPYNVPVNSKTAHPPPPPPGQTPGHLTFLKNFGPIPCYVASLDGQMPHSLELQRGSNPPPSRHVKATVTELLTFGNKFCKIFNHYEFLVQLVFAPHFKQRHIPRYSYIM